MTARILVVDDEPDLEALLIQKFRHQIREGKVEFLFARDGVEALATLEANCDVDMVVTDINMPAANSTSERAYASVLRSRRGCQTFEGG
jgi:adenylate cyclase